jgi:restriction system protein
MNRWDIVLCPDGTWKYYVAEVSSDYYYVPNTPLPHRRKVQRLPIVIDKGVMSDQLRKSIGSIGTVSDATKYWGEIQELLTGHNQPMIIATHEDIEDPSVFALEKHLEDFLVQNRSNTELGKKYDIYSEEWELVGQQFPSDTWPIDILAVSKDRKELLVVELKRWRGSDVVVGQIQRYMWYVKDELAEQGQIVKGAIIALEDDIRLRRALSVTNNIAFYRYKVSFQLLPVL